MIFLKMNSLGADCIINRGWSRHLGWIGTWDKNIVSGLKNILPNVPLHPRCPNSPQVSRSTPIDSMSNLGRKSYHSMIWFKDVAALPFKINPPSPPNPPPPKKKGVWQVIRKYLKTTFGVDKIIIKQLIVSNRSKERNFLDIFQPPPHIHSLSSNCASC